MKQRYQLSLLCFLIFFCFTDLYAQTGAWQVLPNSPERTGGNSRHDDLFFVHPDTGYVVNLSGQVHKTVDGGESWEFIHEERLPDSTMAGFRSVGFANSEVGWIGSLSEGHVLYETRDGGQTWKDITDRISGPLPRGVCGLWIINENVIFGAGRFDGPARIIRSTDGGQTWVSRDMSSVAQTLVDVYFWDAQNGIVVGGNNMDDLGQARAVVLRTFDGGASWQVRHVSSEIGEWGWKISFPTPETGYVSIESFPYTLGTAKMLKTTTAGRSWTEEPIPNSHPLQGIGFLTENHGWTSGRGTTSVTKDGVWSQLDLSDSNSPDGRVNRIRTFGDSLAYAAGKRIYKYTPNEPTHLFSSPEVPSAFTLGQNYPNPFNPSTTISYTLSTGANVKLGVFSLLGKEIQMLVHSYQSTGAYEVSWDGTDENGNDMVSGVYLYRLNVDGRIQTRRMVLLK